MKLFPWTVLSKNSDIQDIKKALSSGKFLWRLLLYAQIILIPLTLLDAVAVQIIMDKVVAKGRIQLLIPILAGIGVLFLGMIFLDALVQYKAIRLSQYWDALIKNRLLRRIMQKAIFFFYHLPSGEILYRLLGDSGVLPQYMTGMRWGVMTNAIMGVAIIVLMFIYDIPLALLMIAIIPFQIAALRYIGGKCRILQEKLKKCDQDLLGYLENVVSNAEAIKAFNLEDRTRHQWITDYRTRLIVERKLMVFQRILATTTVRISSFMFLIVLGFGSYRVTTGSISIGKLMVFLLVGGRLIGPIQYFAGYHLNMQDILMCLRRMRNTWGIYEEKQHPKTRFLLRPGCATKGQHILEIKHLRLSDIGFAYDGKDKVLRNISWEITPGNIYRINGMNGSGKSTLLKILAMLLMPTEGSISVNGLQANQLSMRILRRKILYVTANSFWLKGTIEENLHYGTCLHENFSETELRDCLKITGCNKIIEQMPMGLNSMVTFGGTNLSRGEQQRLALVRALLIRPNILLLDEALSSISRDNVSGILQQAKIFLGNSTAIVYVQHMSDSSLLEEKRITISKGTVSA